MLSSLERHYDYYVCFCWTLSSLLFNYQFLFMKEPGVLTQNHQQTSSEWTTLLSSCNKYISIQGSEIKRNQTRKQEQCTPLHGSESNSWTNTSLPDVSPWFVIKLIKKYTSPGFWKQTHEQVHRCTVQKLHPWTSTPPQGSEIKIMNKYTSPGFRNETHEQVHLLMVQKWNSWTSTPHQGSEMKIMNKYTSPGFKIQTHEQVYLTRVQKSNSWTSTSA